MTHIDPHDATYALRAGNHLIDKALSWGWDPGQGEGAFEFISRNIYERAVEDLVDGHYLAVSHKTTYLLTKPSQTDLNY
jgi:hypothetical protein